MTGQRPPGFRGGPPALVAVAHGTRNPSGPQTVERLLKGVRRRLPGVEVVGSYVELVRPSLDEALSGLCGPAVVVPLLLSTGHHVRTDVPAAVSRACAPVAVAPPLGPSPLLVDALDDRAHEASGEPGGPLVLAAAGSSSPASVQAVHRTASMLSRTWGGPVDAGFLTLASPRLGEVLDRVMEREQRPVTVLPYLLAPGRFACDVARICARDAIVRMARVLGAHPAIADLVARRYLDAAQRPSGCVASSATATQPSVARPA